MEIGWNFLSDYLESYNKVLAGQTPTIYNSPNVVELDTGNFYREEQNEKPFKDSPNPPEFMT